MASLKEEISRRRTFAIISHPDAGKTTLTEKFLLYGGAIQLAGSVKGKKTARHAVSDWMEIEKQRGISVTSSVMQFEYQGYCINILDTPGHQDFSEDTYRTLMAADSAVMVIDAAKGIEPQTRKLFKVCAMRDIPIFTFINKLDREAHNPFDLLEELEKEFGIGTYPVNWPIGCGVDFKGVFDRDRREILAFNEFHNGQNKLATIECDITDTARLDELLGPLLGSALLGVMGLGPLLVLCGACFAASALLEWQIRIPGDRPQPRTQRKPDFAADLRESLTYLYHSRPELLRLAGIMALVNLVEIPAVVVGIPVVIVQYLGQSDVVLGAVQAVLSVGGLAGGALAGRSRHPLSDRQALGLLLGIAGLCAAMGVVLWVPPLACGGVALCGFGVMAAAMRFNVWFFARLQTVLPQAQLGRVTGCTMALASLTQPVGQAVYGVLFDVFSACPAGVLLGAGAVSAVFLTGAIRHETEKRPG